MTEKTSILRVPTGFAAEIDWWFAGPLLRPISSVFAAVVVTAGPWLVSVIALVIVSIGMQPVMGGPAIEDLRLTVVYAFCVAPLVAGPVGAIAARLVVGSLEERGGKLIPEIFCVASVASGLIAQVLAVAICLSLGIEPAGIAIAFVFLSSAAALLWTSFAVLAALRAYRFLISAFSVGMIFSVLCILLTAQSQPSVERMIWSFTAGIVLCVAAASARICAGRGVRNGDLSLAALLIAGEISRNWRICLGIFFAISGVWVDKWVFWFGSEGARSAAGYLHYGVYDSVMFVAHLSVIPSFAMMLMFQRGQLDGAIRLFRRTLLERPTYDRVAEAVGGLERVIWFRLMMIAFFQATCSVVLLLMAPLVADVLSFDFAQFVMLRFGVVAVFLQSLIYLSSCVLIFSNRVSFFLLTQALFFAVNIIASTACLAIVGVSAYGVFFTSLIFAAILFPCAFAALSRYDYLTFVGENEGLYDKGMAGRTRETTTGSSSFSARLANAHDKWCRLASPVDP